MVSIQNTQTGAQSRPIKANGSVPLVGQLCILYTCIHLYIYILYTRIAITEVRFQGSAYDGVMQ